MFDEHGQNPQTHAGQGLTRHDQVVRWHLRSSVFQKIRVNEYYLQFWLEWCACFSRFRYPTTTLIGST